MALSRDEVRRVQAALNAFTNKRLRGVAPLIEDGDQGPATDKRIRQCKYWLGFKVPTGAGVGDKLIVRLREPKHLEHFPDKSFVIRGLARRARQRLRYRQQLVLSTVAPGVTRYDGVPVAIWLVPYLQWARNHGWQGRLVSGWRSPAYSESLCIHMCGAPQCPGTCAGRASNHSGSEKPHGALDVSDYLKFAQVIKGCPRSPRIFNDLPRDLVHFSANGH